MKCPGLLLGKENIIEPLHDKTHKMACVRSKNSDQAGHPPGLNRVFTVCSVGGEGPKLSSCWQRRCRSDWADAQANPSLPWAHMPFCWFCHVYFMTLALPRFVPDVAWERNYVNPCPAEPGYTLPLQTV